MKTTFVTLKLHWMDTLIACIAAYFLASWNDNGSEIFVPPFIVQSCLYMTSVLMGIISCRSMLFSFRRGNNPSKR